MPAVGLLFVAAFALDFGAVAASFLNAAADPKSLPVDFRSSEVQAFDWSVGVLALIICSPRNSCASPSC